MAWLLILPKSRARVSAAVAFLLLGLAGCERAKLDPKEQERADAQAAAKQFFYMFRQPKPSNVAVWGLRDFRVFGSGWDTPEFSQTAPSPPSWRAKYSFWCVGTSPANETVRRRRVLQLDVVRTDKGPFAVSQAQFIADSALAFSDQLGSWIGKLLLLASAAFVFVAVFWVAAHIPLIRNISAWVGIWVVVWLFQENPAAAVGVLGVFLWVCGEDSGWHISAPILYAGYSAYCCSLYFGSYVAMAIGFLVVVVPGLLVVAVRAAGRRRQSVTAPVDSTEIDRLLKEYAESKKGSRASYDY